MYSRIVSLMVINLSILRSIYFQTDSTIRLKGISYFKDVLSFHYKWMYFKLKIGTWCIRTSINWYNILHATTDASMNITPHTSKIKSTWQSIFRLTLDLMSKPLVLAPFKYRSIRFLKYYHDKSKNNMYNVYIVRL